MGVATVTSAGAGASVASFGQQGGGDEAQNGELNRVPQDGKHGLDVVSRVVVTGARDVRLRNPRERTGDRYAFIAGGEAGLFSVVDWKNPRQPELVSVTNVPGGEADDVKPDGDLLLTNNDGGPEIERLEVPAGAHLYDISDETEPEFLGSFYDPDLLPSGSHDTHLNADRGLAYLGNFERGGSLVILDVSDPETPEFLTEWRVEDENPELASPDAYPHSQFEDTQERLHLAYQNAGYRILDVSDPENPEEIGGSLGDPDIKELTDAHEIHVNPDENVAVIGEEAYCPDEPLGYTLFDISDPSNPQALSYIAPVFDDCTFESDPQATSHNVDIEPGRLYTTEYEGGVRVFDITDPSAPDQLAHFQPLNLEESTGIDANANTNQYEMFDTAQYDRGHILATQRSDPDSLYIFDCSGELAPVE